MCELVSVVEDLFYDFLLGDESVGAGLGFEPAAGGVIPTKPTMFSTAGRRKIEDFEGIGSMYAVELGAGFIVGYGGMILADGTAIGPGASSGYALAAGASLFVVMAYWWLRYKAPFRFN